MTSPLGFRGRIGRLPYALWSAALFFSQHLVALGLFKLHGATLRPDVWFAFLPLRALVAQADLPGPFLLVGFGYLLIVAWALAALAYQRAADADISEWIAAAALAPFIQIPVIAYLSFLPSSSATAAAPRGDDRSLPLAGLAYGILACIGVTVAAVALSTLLFSVYGFGLFVISPFVVGAITAYLANLQRDIGSRNTNLLLAAATAMAAIGLVAVALEGIICIVLIAPLAFGLAVLGGMMGRAIAISAQRPARQMLTGFAVLPLMFALESVLPAETSFDTRESIAVNAPPETVWTSLLRMDTIDRRLASDRGVHLTDERRRHGDPVDPPQIGRGREAGDVGRAAAAESDERAAALQSQRMPESLERLDGLCLLSRRQLVARTRPRSERKLDVHAVDPGDPRVADDLDRPLAGNELAETLERTGLAVDTARSEDGTIDIPRSCIRGVVVERLPLLVQRPEGRLVLGQRPVAAADAAPGLLGIDLDEDRHGAISERRTNLIDSDCATAQRYHCWGHRAQGVDRVLRLAEPEGSLTSGLEDPRDRLHPLDLGVDVDERPPEPFRQGFAEGRFAGAHEADQGDVTVYGVRGHSMRSR